MMPDNVSTRISRLCGQSLVAHIAQEAARAVAAMLDFLAVGVEDAVVEVGAGRARRLDQQNLVAADAEMAIGERARVLGVERDRLTHGIEHDEIVSHTLHFGESQPHQRAKSNASTGETETHVPCLLSPRRLLVPMMSFAIT